MELKRLAALVGIDLLGFASLCNLSIASVIARQVGLVARAGRETSPSKPAPPSRPVTIANQKLCPLGSPWRRSLTSFAIAGQILPVVRQSMAGPFQSPLRWHGSLDTNHAPDVSAIARKVLGVAGRFTCRPSLTRATGPLSRSWVCHIWALAKTELIKDQFTKVRPVVRIQASGRIYITSQNSEIKQTWQCRVECLTAQNVTHCEPFRCLEVIVFSEIMHPSKAVFIKAANGSMDRCVFLLRCCGNRLGEPYS